MCCHGRQSVHNILINKQAKGKGIKVGSVMKMDRGVCVILYLYCILLFFLNAFFLSFFGDN